MNETWFDVAEVVLRHRDHQEFRPIPDGRPTTFNVFLYTNMTLRSPFPLSVYL